MRRGAYLAVCVLTGLMVSCGGMTGPAPDFSVSTGSNLTFSSGSGQVISTLEILGENGFNGSIKLKFASLPPGLSATSSPAIAGTGLYFMTWSANDVASGSYDITLEASSGNLQHNYPLTVTIE